MVKFLLAAALLGSVGGVSGGTLAAKLADPSKAEAATVEIALGKPGKKTTLSQPAVGLAAGDQLPRPFDLKHSGGAALAGIALTTTAPVSSALDTDAVNGLQLQIDLCAKRWKSIKETKRYGCPEATVPVILPRPVIGANLALGNLGTLLLKKGKEHLLLTLSLPASAPNTLQGKTSSLTYTFIGTGAAP